MLKDLIASPGEAAAARITKMFRYDGNAHKNLYDAIKEAVDEVARKERQACANLVEGYEDLGEMRLAIAQQIRARNKT